MKNSINDYDAEFIARLKRQCPDLFGPTIRLLEIVPDAFEKPSELRFLWHPNTYKLIHPAHVHSVQEKVCKDGFDFSQYDVVVSILSDHYYLGRVRDWKIEPKTHIILCMHPIFCSEVPRAFTSMKGDRYVMEIRPYDGEYWYGFCVIRPL